MLHKYYAQIEEYIRSGLVLVPVRPRSKAPRERGWPHLRIGVDDIKNWFQPGDNVGLVLGDPSGGIVDIDLDCPEAVALAPLLLPPTGLRYGRTTRPGSHRLYRVPAFLRTTPFRCDRVGMLVEIRANGCQSLVPPSVHPDGDAYVWDAFSQPAPVDGDELRQCVANLAIAALVLRLFGRRLAMSSVRDAASEMLARYPEAALIWPALDACTAAGGAIGLARGCEEDSVDLLGRIGECAARWHAQDVAEGREHASGTPARTRRRRARRLQKQLPIDLVLDRLHSQGCAVRRQQSGFYASCPAHDDKHPSLRVSVSDVGNVLIHCHGGCPVTAVLAALSLNLSSLFNNLRSSLK